MDSLADKRTVKSLLTVFFVCGLLSWVCGQTPSMPFVGLKSVADKKSIWQELHLEQCQTEVNLMGAQAIVQHLFTFTNGDLKLKRRSSSVPDPAFPAANFYFALATSQKLIRWEMATNEQPFREAKVLIESGNTLVFEPETNQEAAAEDLQSGAFFIPTPLIKTQGSLKIKIVLLQELSALPNLMYRFNLNGLSSRKIPSFALFIKNIPKKLKAPNAYEDIYFSEYGAQVEAQLSRQNFEPKHDFVLDIPYTQNQLFVSGRGRIEPYTYINGYYKPSLVATARTLPRTIALLWDASGSAQHRHTERELKFLNDYFQKIGTFELDICVFNRVVLKRQKFLVQDGNWQEAQNLLKNVRYDGATNFACLNALQDLRVEEIILSTDGAQSYEKNTLRLPLAPVLCLAAFEYHEPGFLKAIADSTNGRYLPLLARSDSAALAECLAPRLRLLRANFDETQLSAFWPQNPVTAQNDYFKLSAQVLKDSGLVELVFEDEQKKRYIEKFMFKKMASSQGFWVESLWLDHKIEALSADLDNNRAAIKELCVRYNYPAAFTAWALPESMSDYFNLGLQPPAEFKEEFEVFLAYQRKENMLFALSAEQMDSLSQKRLWAAFNLQKTWYNASFKTSEDDLDFDKQKRQNELYLSALTDFKRLDAQFNLPQKNNPFSKRLYALKPHSGLPQGTFRLSVQPWLPKAAYLNILEQTARNKYNDAYLLLKEAQNNNIGFYVDCALFFWSKNEKELALQALSNLNEIGQHNIRILRLVAGLLIDFKQYKASLSVFEHLAKAYAQEPHTKLDLARAYVLDGNLAAACKNYIQLLKDPLNNNLRGIKEVATTELNRCFSTAPDSLQLNAPKELKESMPVDLRIIARWNENIEDVDLRVTDPLGNTVGDSVRYTRTGGRMSTDIVGTYGAEEFMQKNALEGNYRIEVNATTAKLKYKLAPTSVRVAVFSNYGRGSEEREPFLITLTDSTPTTLVTNWLLEQNTEPSHTENLSRFQNLKLTEPAAFCMSQDDSRLIAIGNNELKVWGTQDGVLQSRIEDLASGGTTFKHLLSTLDSQVIVMVMDSLMIAPESFSQEFEWMDAFFESSVSVIKIFNLQQKRVIKSFILPDSALYTAVSCPEEQIVRFYTEKGVYKLDLVEQNLEVEKIHPVRGFTHLAAGRRYVAYTYKRKALFASAHNLRIVASAQGDNILKTALSLDSTRALCLNQIGSQSHLLVVDIPNNQTISSFKTAFLEEDSHLAMSSNGQYFAFSSPQDRLLHICSAENAAELMTYGHRNQLRDISFGHHNTFIASADEGQQVKIKRLDNLPYYALQFNATQPYLETSPSGDFLCLATGSDLKIFEKMPNISPSIYKEAEWLNYNLRNSLKQPSSLNLITDKGYRCLLGVNEKRGVNSVFMLPLDSALGTSANLLNQWLNFFKFQELNTILLSPNKRILAFDQNGEVRVMDIKPLTSSKTTALSHLQLQKAMPININLQELKPDADALNDQLTRFVFSPNSRVLGIKRGSKVWVWDLTKNVLLAESSGAQANSNALSFTPDSKHLVFETKDHALWVWDFKKKQGRLLQGHKGLIQDLSLTLHGKEQVLISAASDNSLRLWDLKSLKTISVFTENDPKFVLFVDANHFVSLSQKGQLKFWKHGSSLQKSIKNRRIL